MLALVHDCKCARRLEYVDRAQKAAGVRLQKREGRSAFQSSLGFPEPSQGALPASVNGLGRRKNANDPKSLAVLKFQGFKGDNNWLSVRCRHSLRCYLDTG